MNLYDFTVTDNQGNEVALAQYRGKVLLVVNTATRCGLTPQYEQLEALYAANRDRGFEVLDFPSNEFLGQAPGTDAEIDSFCTLQYATTFPRFAKTHVNGKEASPLFVWLKAQAPEDEADDAARAFEKKVKLLKPFARPGDIKWNFGKFLIDREGNVAGRFSPAYVPSQLQARIDELL